MIQQKRNISDIANDIASQSARMAKALIKGSDIEIKLGSNGTVKILDVKKTIISPKG